MGLLSPNLNLNLNPNPNPNPDPNANPNPNQVPRLVLGFTMVGVSMIATDLMQALHAISGCRTYPDPTPNPNPNPNPNPYPYPYP